MLTWRRIMMLGCILVGCGITLFSQADTFTETFTSTTYKDPSSAVTTANWDTTLHEVRLPSTYAFTQPSGTVVWGGQINAIAQNGSYWLLGGNGAKINRYNGSTYTDLSSSLETYQGKNIRALAYGSSFSYWLVVGESGRINKYNGSSFTDLSAGLNWGTYNALAAAAGSGSENFWLVGGGASGVGKLSKYNGTSFSSLDNWLGAYGNTYTVNAIGFNGTYWLIGGTGGRLAKYVGGTFTDLTYSPNLNFGSDAIYTITWNSGTGKWLIGGSNQKLVAYDGTTFTNYTSSVGSFNSINAIAHNGSYWLLVGQGTGSTSIVYSWDETTFRDQSANLSSMGSGIPLYAVAGNGTEWLLGGAQAKLNNHTGTASSTTYNNRSNLLAGFGLDDIFAQGYNATDVVWLFGGANRHLNSYNGSSFTDISSGLSGFAATDAIKAIAWNSAANTWLLGGSNGHVNRYNGSSFTDLTSSLGWGAGITVNAIVYQGGVWYIGGDSAHLASYNGTTFTDLSTNISAFGSQPVLSLDYVNGHLLVGGGNGYVSWYDGGTWTDIRADLNTSCWGGYYSVNSITNDGAVFYLGGDSGHVGVFDPTAVSFVNYSSTLASVFGSNNVLSVCWNAPEAFLLIGGQNAKLAKMIVPGGDVENYTSKLINYGTSSINAITPGLDSFFLGGVGAQLNRYGPVYDSPSWAQSTTVASSTQNFYSVTLTATDNVPAGTRINYWLTANGQLADAHSNWIQATPGQAVIFTNPYDGLRLKWKAELVSDSSTSSPRILQINLQYVIPPTATPTRTPTHSPTYTATSTVTRTATLTATPTPTFTATYTITPTLTATPTITPTLTQSATYTASPTVSPTSTNIILSATITPTSTVTTTGTPTLTATPTATLSATHTASATITPTPSVTPTLTVSATCTESATISPTATWTASPTATPNPLFTFSYGSLIIPMDTNGTRANQNYGMWRAYGLVYYLLSNGVPVSWAIKSPKVYEENDFTALQTTELIGNPTYPAGTVYNNAEYNGGPFLIAAANSTTAMTLINRWNTGTVWNGTSATNARVVVHQYTNAVTPLTAPIYRRMRAAPSICVFQNDQGNATGAYTYLNYARIPDSRGNTALTWTNTSPDSLLAASLAGASTTDHHDGGLFLTTGGLPKYSQFINMHWDPARAYTATSANNAETIRELDTFLNYPSSHVYAQCISVYTFENDLTAAGVYGGYGHWLTTGGMNYTAAGITLTAINQEVAFWPSAQATGIWTTATGAQTAFNMATGSQFYGGTSSVIQFNMSSTGNTYPNMYMSGYYKGITGCGRVSYMCQHTSPNTLPYTSNVEAPAMRYFYNSLFMSPSTSETVPEMYLTMTAPGEWEAGSQMTYTITYQNLSGIAYNVVLTDPIPANTTYVSSTGGGVPGGGVVTWNLGTLNVGASGSFTVTYTMNASPGGWDNQASVAYSSGPTHFGALTQNIHTSSVIYTPTATITTTSTRTPTYTQTPTMTSTATMTPTQTPTSTISPTTTPTATGTITPSHTVTSTITQTATMTPTITVTSTITETSTITMTRTNTPVYSPTTTPTFTPTSTVTPTLTASATYTATPSVTPTSTITRTATGTPTGTRTPTFTSTPTITQTATQSVTSTETPYFTVTQTVTVTPTATFDRTSLTATPTVTMTPWAEAGKIYVYPNPFKPDTASGHVLKFDNCPEGTEIRIYTVTGELVRKYADVSGKQTWDGKNTQGSDVASGVYMYVVVQSDGSKTLGKVFVVR